MAESAHKRWTLDDVYSPCDCCVFFVYSSAYRCDLHSFPTRRSSDLGWPAAVAAGLLLGAATVVRLAGEPAVLAAVLYVLLTGRTWLRRAALVEIGRAHV